MKFFIGTDSEHPGRYLPPKAICPLGHGPRFITIAHGSGHVDDQERVHSEICLRHADNGKLISIISTDSEIWQVASSPSGKEFVTTSEAVASDEENGNDLWRFSYLNVWKVTDYQ